MQVIIGANLGADGKAWRNRNTDPRHLVKTGSLAAEQLAHLRVAFGFTVSKKENLFSLIRHAVTPNYVTDSVTMNMARNEHA
jgi:hypothetical protein